MATIASSYSGAGVDDTHRVSLASSDQWDFSVPDPLESKQPHSSPPPSSHNLYRNDHPFSPLQNEMKSPQAAYHSRPKEIDLNGVTGANGTGSIGRSSKRNNNVDPAYLSPYKDTFERPTASRSGSEPDSLLDLYKNQRNSASKSIGEATPEPKRSDYQPPEPEPIEVDDPPNAESGWIHREKLLQIEKKEMQELGITPPPAPRAHSRTKSRRERDRSQDRYANGEAEQEPDIRSAKEGKKRRVHSPIRQEEEPEGVYPPNTMDLRTPEEITTENNLERTTSPVYRQQQLRSSSSRIPLPKTTQIPMPKDSTPRKRGASYGENDLSNPSNRSRNNSINSTNLLSNDYENFDPTKTPTSTSRPTSASASPTKPRTSSLPKHAQHNRKLSNPLSTPTSQQLPKPRSTSTNTTPRSPPSTTTPTIRPKSRQGLDPRPPTAINRPEGEPPWIKEMYKPDPRLPPEQQMLPTHAKRLQQEQWDQSRKESDVRQRELGKPVDARERAGERERQASPEKSREVAMQGQRAFSPLAHHTHAGLVSSRDGPAPMDKDSSSPKKADAWNEKRNPSVTGDGQGRSPTGNYSPLPPLPKGDPPTGLRKEMEKRTPVDPFERERLARLEEDRRRVDGTVDGEKEAKRKDKGCGCCVVM